MLFHALKKAILILLKNFLKNMGGLSEKFSDGGNPPRPPHFRVKWETLDNTYSIWSTVI